MKILNFLNVTAEGSRALRAYERAGQPDSAIVVYQRYVGTPWGERWSSDGEFTGHALLRIGELSKERRDTAKATSEDVVAAAVRRYRARPQLAS